MSDPYATEEKVRGNMSVFNPTDIAMMGQNGMLRQDMTVRQYLETVGIDVDGPVSQFKEAAQSQMQKADGGNKMKAIAGAPGMGQAPQQPRPQGQPQGRGVADLLGMG